MFEAQAEIDDMLEIVLVTGRAWSKREETRR